MNLSEIQEELKQSLLAKDEVKVGTLRMLISEIKNWQIDKQTEPTEEDLVQIIRQQVKRRREAAEAYSQAGRTDLAAKEAGEEVILNHFLPQQLSDADLEKIVKETIDRVKPNGMADFGKVMGAVMGQVKGQADGNQVSVVVKKLLN